MHFSQPEANDFVVSKNYCFAKLANSLLGKNSRICLLFVVLKCNAVVIFVTYHVTDWRITLPSGSSQVSFQNH